MTIPLAVNLGFAVWTLLLLFGSVGVYRWSRILTGRQGLDQFPADRPVGADWYRRAMRAHANCVENLPVFTAIVLVADRIGITGAVFDVLAIGVVAARVPQSSIHVGLTETPTRVGSRFGFFLLQALCMLGMAVLIVASHGSPTERRNLFMELIRISNPYWTRM